jgi:hypothetical protein
MSAGYVLGSIEMTVPDERGNPATARGILVLLRILRILIDIQHRSLLRRTFSSSARAPDQTQCIHKEYIDPRSSTLQPPDFHLWERVDTSLLRVEANAPRREADTTKISVQPKVAPPDRNMSGPAFRPGQDPLFDQNAIAKDFDSCSLDALRNTVWKKHFEGTIGIHHVFDVRNSYRHLASVAFRDRAQLRGSFEMAACLQSNAKAQTDTDRFEIDDATGHVRSLIVLEATLSPQASVASADLRPYLVDSTALLTTLMRAVFAGTLAELVDAQDCAAKGTGATGARGRTNFARC